MPTQFPHPAAWRVAPPHPQGLPRQDGEAPTPVLDLLDAAACAYGTRAAFIDPQQRLSFADLATHARAVAHRIASTVPPGGAVAAVLPYSPLGVATAFGCLASGRVTLALNAHDPADRLAQALAGAALVLQAEPGPQRLTFAEAGATPVPAGWQPPPPGADAPAMVHFTSGSSGAPKGIVLSNHAVATRARAAMASLCYAPGDRVMATSGPHVASGFSFLFAAIMAGATHLCASLSAQGAGGILRLMQADPPDVTITNAALSGMLLGLPGGAEAFARVRLHRMGAMGLARADWEAAVAALPRGCAISHTYASTEAQVVAEWQVPATPPPGPSLPAGWLTEGWRHALVDPDGNPVPDGTPGELVLSDRRIALGEWHAGTIVPGRMQPDPQAPSRRIFRTGDVMRLAPDGMLSFVGRADRQINVNGVRIEPGEIEAVLREHPGVLAAAVVADAAGRPAAFVSAPGTADAPALRAALAARARAALPAAMRPAAITVLPALPMMPSGKIDLVALRRKATEG